MRSESQAGDDGIAPGIGYPVPRVESESDETRRTLSIARSALLYHTARGGTPSISPILVTTGEQIIYTRSILEFLSGVPKPSLLTRQTTLKTEQTDGRIEQTNVEVVSHDTLRVLHQFESP